MYNNFFNSLKCFGFRSTRSIFREKICSHYNKFLITYIKLPQKFIRQPAIVILSRLPELCCDDESKYVSNFKQLLHAALLVDFKSRLLVIKLLFLKSIF